jgi:hypothetical protein
MDANLDSVNEGDAESNEGDAGKTKSGTENDANDTVGDDVTVDKSIRHNGSVDVEFDLEVAPETSPVIEGGVLNVDDQGSPASFPALSKKGWRNAQSDLGAAPETGRDERTKG